MITIRERSIALGPTLLALGMLALTGVAQQRKAGSEYVTYHDPTRGEKGVLQMSLNSSELEWHVMWGPIPWLSGTEIMPFNLAGGIVQVGDRTFVASGLYSPTGEGVLVKFILSPTLAEIQITQWNSYGTSFDPMDLFWHETEQRLYVLDHAGKKVWVLPFDETQDLPLDLTAFQEVASATGGVEVLADLANAFLLAPYHGEADGVGVLSSKEAEEYTHVYLNGPVWTWEVKETIPPTGVSAWNVWDPHQVDEQGPVFVTSEDTNYDLIDADTGATVSQGMIHEPNGGWVNAILPESGLIPGGLYYFSSTFGGGVRDSVRFVPMVRHASATGNVEIKMFRAYDRRLRVGDSGFALHGKLGWAEGYSQAVTVPVYVGAAFRQPDGSDPWIPQAGHLDPAFLALFLGPDSTLIEDDVRHGTYWFDVPIPSNPALEGMVMLWQFVAVAPNGQLVYSDIVGATILPAQAAAAAQSLTQGGTQAIAKPTAESFEAARQWLQSLPNAVKSPQKERLIRELFGKRQ